MYIYISKGDNTDEHKPMCKGNSIHPGRYWKSEGVDREGPSSNFTLDSSVSP